MPQLELSTTDIVSVIDDAVLADGVCINIVGRCDQGQGPEIEVGVDLDVPYSSMERPLKLRCGVHCDNFRRSVSGNAWGWRGKRGRRSFMILVWLGALYRLHTPGNVSTSAPTAPEGPAQKGLLAIPYDYGLQPCLDGQH